jgi:hypothetical protein
LTIQEIVGLFSDAGVVGVLVFIIVGGYRQWFVWQWQYREKAREAEEWKRLALSGTALAEKAIGVAKQGQESEAR